MTNDDEYLSFMYPVLSGVMGGVQHQIINLITYFAKNGYLVRLYDYEYGLIRRKLEENGVRNYQFCLLDNSHVIKNIGGEVFILTGTLGIKYPLNFKNKNVKIIIWDVYTPVWYDFDKVKRLFTIPKLKNDFFRLVSELHGVSFMEDTGLHYFNNQIKEKKFTNSDIIPVCLPLSDIDYDLKLGYDKNAPLIIGYIGRAVDWKIFPVKYLLSELLKSNVKFKLKVITNNKAAFSEILQYDDRNIEFLDGLTGHKLEKYIVDNINVGYSMGVSALEFGKFGIPTILADFSKMEFDDNYRFQWLKDSKMYSLGKDIREIKDYSDRHTICHMLKNDFEYEKIGLETKDYINTHHSIEVTGKKIIAKMKDTNLYASSYQGLSFKIYKLHYRLNRLFNINDKFKGWAKK